MRLSRPDKDIAGPPFGHNLFQRPSFEIESWFWPVLETDLAQSVVKLPGSPLWYVRGRAARQRSNLRRVSTTHATRSCLCLLAYNVCVAACCLLSVFLNE